MYVYCGVDEQLVSKDTRQKRKIPKRVAERIRNIADNEAPLQSPSTPMPADRCAGAAVRRASSVQSRFCITDIAMMSSLHWRKARLFAGHSGMQARTEAPQRSKNKQSSWAATSSSCSSCSICIEASCRTSSFCPCRSCAASGPCCFFMQRPSVASTSHPSDAESCPAQQPHNVEDVLARPPALRGLFPRPSLPSSPAQELGPSQPKTLSHADDVALLRHSTRESHGFNRSASKSSVCCCSGWAAWRSTCPATQKLHDFSQGVQCGEARRKAKVHDGRRRWQGQSGGHRVGGRRRGGL